MGTAKKVVLASLISGMVVLAFAVGLVPSSQTLGAFAASAGNGRIDMVDLLNAVLNLGDKTAATSIEVVEPPDGTTYVLRTDATSAYVTVEAQANGDASPVVFGVDGAGAGNPAMGWTGTVYTDPTSVAPYKAMLDIAGLMAGKTAVEAHNLYAFGMAQVVKGTFQYQIVSAPRAFNLLEVAPASVDADNNGIPDSFLTGVSNQDRIWLANVTRNIYDAAGNIVGQEMRDVAVANLGAPTTKAAPQALGITVNPNADVSVTTPTLEQFQAADAAYAGYTAGALIVSAASDLSMIPDKINGSTSGAVIGPWAAGVLAKGPSGGLVAGGQFLEASIIMTDGVTFHEVSAMPDGLTVGLTFRNLAPAGGEAVQLWSYSTLIDQTGGNYYVTNEADETNLEWQYVAVPGASDPAGTLTANVSSLSVFAPFKTASILYVEGTRGPVNTANPVRICASFATGMAALSAAQADAAYVVYFGGMPASFREVGGTAVVPAKGAANFYVNTPVYPIAESVDVRIIERAHPANVAILPAGYAFMYPLTVVAAAPNSVNIAPTSPDGLYAANAVVTLTPAPVAGWEFTNWTGDATGTANPLQVTMTTPKTITANFNQIMRSLTMAVNPAGTGTTTPTGTNNYTNGTVVNIQATPVNAVTHHFVNWTGTGVSNVADPNSASTTITMNSDASLVANFAPNGVLRTLTIDVQPAGTGSVDLSPLGGIYPDQQTVTLTANATTGYTFFGWDGDLTGTTNPATISMTADKNVIAYFTNSTPTLTAVRTVEGQTTASAWLFGGVVAEAVGSGFNHGITLRVEGSTAVVQPIAGTLTPTSFRFVIPPLDAVRENDPVYGAAFETLRTNGNLGCKVTVTNVPATKPSGNSAFLDNAISYYLWARDTTVATTAFLVDATAGAPTEVDLQLLAGQVFGDAKLTLPVPQVLDKPTSYLAYGLVHAAKLTLGSSPIFSHQINAGAGSTPVDNAYDFAVHLYSTGANTNTALGDVVHNEITSAWSYDRAGETSALLRFPAAGMTVGDVRSGVSMWSTDTTLTDYSGINNGDTWLTGTLSGYQSTILATDVVPAITAESLDATVLNEVVARLYDFSVFSLRKGADLSSVLAPGGDNDGLTLYDNNGHRITNLFYATGDKAGGTLLRLRSANGGLGWGVTVVLGDYSGSPGKAVTNASNLALATIENVTSEYEIVVRVPAYPTSKRVDVALYPRAYTSTTPLTGANPGTQPVAVFQNGFLYTGGGNANWLLALLGLLAAIIGLGAGGNSGGGGGGPCFIATAAYGTPMSADIDTLRALRDTYMLNNAAGTAFVDMYYRVSPFIADIVAANPVIAALVRMALVPVIFTAKLFLTTPVVGVLFAGLAAAFTFKRRRSSKKA